MSEFDKLLERIFSLDKNLRFDEVKKVLISFGYEPVYPRGGSSHCQFRKDYEPAITIPNHGRIKVCYVEMVKKAIEKELEK